MLRSYSITYHSAEIFSSQLLCYKQLLAQKVAQLWQRDRAKLDTFSINVQRYSQNHAQNCIFGPPYGRIRVNISALFECFNAKKLCSRVPSRECQFFRKTAT